MNKLSFSASMAWTPIGLTCVVQSGGAGMCPGVLRGPYGCVLRAEGRYLRAQGGGTTRASCPGNGKGLMDLPGFTTVDLSTVSRSRGWAAHAPNRHLARLRSVPFSEVAEAILGVALIVGASFLIPGQWGFPGWEPHPLWIVVLAIAVRYAVPAGYVASGLAAGSQILLLTLH